MLTLLLPSLLPALLAPLQDSRKEKQALDPKLATNAQRIWSENMNRDHELWFRRSFSLPKGATNVRIVSTCDDICTVYLDGRKLSEAGAWEELRVTDLESLPAGKHVVAVHAKNRGGPAALALWVTWRDANGKKQQLTTDRSWRYETTKKPRWRSRDFDDRGWRTATELDFSRYAETVYNTKPTRVVFTTGVAALTDDIEGALQKLRDASDIETKLDALAEIQKKVLAARRLLRRKQQKSREATRK